MAKAPINKLTAGDIQDLAIAVEQLTEEARLLRMSLDELRDDVVWAARQVLATGYQISGTLPPAPTDPLAGAPLPTASPFCCDRPKLRWYGDSESPGVACENCGYVVAENGNVVMGQDGADTTKAHRTQQGSLF